MITRRTLLRGAGTSVALPLLEAMIPAGKTVFAQEQQPVRMLAYYVPNGFHMPAWRPVGTGESFEFGATMASLQELKADVQILSNIANRPAIPPGNGAHASGTGGFLTARQVRKTQGSNIRNGRSVDQAAAQGLVAQGKMTTPFASIELGMNGGGAIGNCDSGYSCAYTNNISWADENTPKPKITNARLLFDRIFAGEDAHLTVEERNQRKQYNKSVLDYVNESINKLNQQIGQRDKNKLEEYFDGIRELERKMDNGSGLDSCAIPERPEQVFSVPNKIKIMSDLMVLAFECDLTRIQTFMLANAASNNRYDFLGVNGAHHQISHHQMSQANFNALKVIDKWEVEQLAYLLQQLKSKTDASGASLLDSSMIFFSSEISDGDWHNHTDMPVILAGHANGKLNPGQHRKFTSEESFGNLYKTMLEAFGTPVESFGDNGERNIAL